MIDNPQINGNRRVQVAKIPNVEHKQVQDREYKKMHRLPKTPFLRSKKALFLASFLLAASAYADEECLPLIPAYNYPVRCEQRCPYDIYTELSFNYWQPIQENMEVGLLNNGASTKISASGLTITNVSSSDSHRDVNMDFDFKPGFTLGLGCNFDEDNWDLRLEYTWFHNTQRKSETARDFVLFNASSQSIAATWGTPTPSAGDVIYQFAKEKWKLGMDLLDLDLGRWFYVGCNLTFHPSFGVRAALIEQKVHVSYTNGFANYTVDLPGLLGGGTLLENKNVQGKSRSWGLGPKAALETHWLLGRGFRLFGNGEADLLYTRYTALKESTGAAGTVLGIINLIPFSFTTSNETRGKQRNVGCLRTHLELELGVGWGTYLECSDMCIDCSAGYDFQVFFDQNMLRRHVTDPGGSLPNGNLYTQGLIAKVRLDF